MKNYAEMSDFEINWRVFETLFGGSPDFKEGEKSSMVLTSEEYDVQMGEYVTIEAVRGEFNPCNSWSHAGPIIEENKIDLKFGDDVHETLKGCCMAYSETHSATHDNPLRAAMIVFLMIHENDKP